MGDISTVDRTPEPDSGNANESTSHGDSAERPSSDTGISEDVVLSQLKDPEINAEAIERISQNRSAMQSRKVRFAMALHGHTPRRIALRVIRELYTFELMQFALVPTAPADLKRVADESLIGRLASITLGERISLARRCSGAVVGGLLLDKEPRVWQTALENPRLTEAGVVRALQKAGVSRPFVEAVSCNAKWSTRAEVRFALLRNAFIPVAKAIEFASRIPPQQLRDILHASKLPEKIKSLLLKEAEDKG